MSLLGIDIGTSACKVAVFSEDGEVLKSYSREYPVYYPKSGYAEQNPDEWYAAICSCIKELSDYDITAIGIDGQGWSCIPVDKNHNSLCNTPIWFDMRSTKECKSLSLFDEEIWQVSQNPIQPSYSTPKALWFKNNYPEIYNKAYKFLMSNSFIAMKLTGNILQDKSMSYGHYFYNMKTCEYDYNLLEKIGLNSNHYPEIVDSHHIVGEITEKASKETGLKTGIPVIIGGLDAACGTLGAGVIHAGQTQEQGGQAGGMSICTKSHLSDKRLILGNHVVPDLYLLQGGTVAGGAAMNWFKKEFGGTFGEIDSCAEVVSEASEGLIFLPYLNGERSPIWDENAKGVYYGVTFKTTKAHFARATMEGTAFALRHNLETAKKTGAKIEKLYSVGGAANSKLWMQIKSDITGYEMVVPNSENATTLGAVILAGAAAKVYRDFSDAISKTVRFTAEYKPKKYDQYEKSYEKYLKIYEQLKGVMSE